MSQAVITQAFEQWKAQQAATSEAVTLDEFVFAHVPDLDVDAPIDREEAVPPAAQIVHRQTVSRTGVVNDNAVAYSVVLGADTGDFTFNWVGLINKTSGTLAMIVHAPEQQKLKTKDGQQGNVLTRSFLMEFDGAQTETQIETPAETWQIDFTARLAGMDERLRLENTDIYGEGAFFDDGYLVGKTGTQYFVTKGAGYVAGLRAVLAANKNITVTTKPVKVWLDVSWTGALTSVWAVQQKITVAATHADYLLDGVQHYVFALASIDADGNITDLRPKGTLSEQQGNSDFLRKDANFADLTDPVKACDNLKLGTAAKALLTTSARDTTLGRVLRVQDYGIGRTLGVVTTGIDFQSYVFIQGEHLFVNMSTCTNIPTGLSASTYYFISVHGIRDSDASPGLTLVNYNNSSEMWVAYGSGAAGNRIWSLWRQYNTGYKPSASDIGAVNKSGDTMSGTLKVGAEVQSTSANSFRIAYGNYGTFWRNDGTRLYLMITATGDAAGSYNDLRPFNVSLATGAVTMGNGATINGGLTLGTALPIGSGGTGSTTAAGARTALGCGTAATMSYSTAAYTALAGATTEAANTEQLVGLRDAVYTKTAADALYMQAARLGAETSVTMNDGNTYKAPDGSVVTGITKGGGGNPTALFYKSIQQNKNGTWVTITG